ncbi:hypothetical protein CHLNCDRAFT_137383 [Chlorella variabilis]|uniref:GH16 domain-containing protein n=1 Tax=Chlorella variabilis TaxID=554065 RepID=E1ZMB3_CHLVA|nr:hypothetical protein CHLNCDRAFT_137383 [Chlorella variabilis]EFN52976.1 hypothetical protein CHLNCDRAFT_137383 [Chlorella variabilis]|eukprot:XP_005845078.1 hypothetical protein CHLNCDRAFT_137383 [Chlorella variabilis]
MPVPPWALPLALALVAAIATPAAAAGCQAPYEALPGGLDWQVAPGEVRQFPAGLTIAAGTRVLLEGTANVTGGVTIRGHLFLSSASSSTLAADWVVVEAGGSLQAGSEACPLPPTVSATVLLRNGAVHPQAGRKALAGALLERNVAVGVAGHAFFLEDGAETGNTLRGNLGLLVRPKTEGARLGSDRDGPNGDLSVFWITNPSANTGDPGIADSLYQRWDAAAGRSAVRVQDMSGIITGLKLYDGPIVVTGLTARAWPAGTSPLGLRSNNGFQMAAGTSVAGFAAQRCSYRFVVQDTTGDGGRTTSLLDVDGSLSGYRGATLLPHSAATSLGFYSSPGCAAHPAYGLACPQRYMNLEVGGWDWSAGGAPPRLTLARANLSPGRVGAAGLAAQRLPSLGGGELAPKNGRGGRYYNAKAAVTGGCTNNNEGSCTWTQPFTSARVRTKLSPFGSWKYGRVEVRARMPRGDFLWPAIWLLPTDNAYGTWAASGEIDILECRGQAGLADVVEGTLHYGGQWPANTWTGSGRVRPFPGLDYSATFHDFALEWTSNLTTGRPLLMRWLVDGTEFYRRRLDVSLKTHDASPYTQDGQPWDKRFHLILNLAVGGGFFPAGEFGEFGPSQWDAAAAGWQKPRLEIDHLKVWAWPPPG